MPASASQPSSPEILKWIEGIEFEVLHWRRFFAEKGWLWADDYNRRLLPDSVFNPRLERLLPPGKVPALIVDVGSGPLTVLGKISEGRDLTIIACDPLMDVYKSIMSEFGLSPLTKAFQAFAEDLSSYFDVACADLVFCMNALDHSYDPIRSIEEMLKIVKPSGAIFLVHNTNEAERESYEGFHQWNFQNDKGRFIVWNKEQRIDVAEHLSTHAEVDADGDDNGVVVTIRKNHSCDEYFDAAINNRRRQRIVDLYHAVTTVAVSTKASEPTLVPTAPISPDGIANQCDELISRNEWLEQQLDAMRGSTSWRVTSPLRSLKRMLGG